MGKALVVLLLLELTPLNPELTLLNLELTLLSLEATPLKLELTLFNLELTHNSLEVILPNMATILRWSHSREAIQYSQAHIQGRLEDIHHLRLATLLQVKSQQQLEQQD